MWSGGAVRTVPGCRGEEAATQGRAHVTRCPPSLRSGVRPQAPAVHATTVSAAPVPPSRTAAATMTPGATSVPPYRPIHRGESSATAPPSAVVASGESEPIVGGEACNGSSKGSAVDGKTASSCSGPRKRGVKRSWKDGVGADSRAFVPGRISPLEEALRCYGDRGAGPIIAPRAGLEFDSCEEAFDYYNLYSWEMGFGIRYSSSQSYKKRGEIYRNMVSFVCVCGGTPDAGSKKSIKQGCPAFVRLLRTDDDGWYIKEFVADHNHKMSETCAEISCWKSHRQIDPHTKELVKNLRANNVSLTEVSCILSSFFGNNNASAVTKRALRSLTVQNNSEKVEGDVHQTIENDVQINREAEDDVQKTIEVFNRLHEEDEGFANVVDLDEGGKIKTMMWTNGKSRRWKNGVGPDSRKFVPGRISPLEEALRRYGDRGAGPIIAPRAGLEFDSCEEAFDYYNLYSWEMGFGIRYSTSQSYKKRGEIYRNRVSFVCACGGTPDAGSKKSIKQGCPAFMRLLRTDDDGWYIKEFVADHNHKMSKTCGEQSCWKSHRQIDPHTKEVVKNLRANNVSLTEVSCILSSFFGNNNASAVTKRALRSLTVQINREKVEGNVHKTIEDNVQINREVEDDVQKTIEVFNRLHEEDEGFANVVDLDEGGKIKAMMWTNGKSRHDYLCFGDAITFDTTYRTNKYNMPFGLFVGANKHFQSVIFAGVLMLDESIKSFEWGFTQFVALMGGKVPKTILTDQCSAMEVALANKFPEITHRWCKWHVFRTIKAELGQKYTKEFKEELNKMCNHMLTSEEFEAGWGALVTKHGLKNNVYMSNIYNNRHMWAKAYFSGKFCAKQTSTQRCESANHVLKGSLSPGATMHIFVEQYHKLLSELIEKEDGKEHEDKLPLTETSTGWPIESHAAEFYTKTMLGKFVDHMKQGAKYDVVEIVPRRKYRLDHVDPLSCDKWYRSSYMVDVREDGGYYQCECGMWDHMGILCCHSIRLMMQLMVRKIPEQHLLRRWSRNGNKVESDIVRQADLASYLHTSRSFRNASLTNKARELVELGDLNIECYDLCYKGICELIEQVKSKRPNTDVA
ncbi:protein FAR1-RELATED SEQUENCE 5 isoform X3 [Setaria viridis]|uniref:SWIM-type domain-containing protein n=2 Tax=Setaria viridis TaxID=4556 RepID=A0A4U6UCL4_SETVI|nr:protein FAR1-RELATED SEQUENCE 7-like isoform X3 [Setaria viridis]TKW13710.1 hypothetical protein SEVIR_5G119201v2 [Setaria viridis]